MDETWLLLALSPSYGAHLRVILTFAGSGFSGPAVLPTRLPLPSTLLSPQGLPCSGKASHLPTGTSPSSTFSNASHVSLELTLGILFCAFFQGNDTWGSKKWNLSPLSMCACRLAGHPLPQVICRFPAFHWLWSRRAISPIWFSVQDFLIKNSGR